MDNITIRLEQTSDYRETEEVVREAFWNVYSPGCTEHYLLHTMRGSSGFVRELDFVAESGGRIIGAAVSQKGYILGDDGNRYGVLTLGPIAVLPSFQHRGTGRALIEHTRAAAAEKGYRAILLCGDPEYYRNVGFTAAEHYGIRMSAIQERTAGTCRTILRGRHLSCRRGQGCTVRQAVPAQRDALGHSVTAAFQGNFRHGEGISRKIFLRNLYIRKVKT